MTVTVRYVCVLHLSTGYTSRRVVRMRPPVGTTIFSCGVATDAFVPAPLQS